MSPPRPLRLDEAAALIGRNPSALKAAAQRGDLSCLRVGDGYRFHPAELQRWRARR